MDGPRLDYRHRTLPICPILSKGVLIFIEKQSQLNIQAT